MARTCASADIRRGRQPTKIICSGLPDANAALRVIMFSAYDVDESVFGARRAGARGYLLTGAAGSELIAAIRTVHCH